jgi:hypothetical protein
MSAGGGGCFVTRGEACLQLDVDVGDKAKFLTRDRVRPLLCPLSLCAFYSKALVQPTYSTHILASTV